MLLLASIALADCPEVFASKVHAFLVGPGVEPAWGDPQTALGEPDFFEGTGAVSLGNAVKDGATLTVSFPVAIQEGEGPDIRIYERGPSAEPTRVEVYADGAWVTVGRIRGSVREVDLGRTKGLAGAVLTKVRLTALRDDAAGPWAGPDIDAVSLLNTCAQPNS